MVNCLLFDAFGGTVQLFLLFACGLALLRSFYLVKRQQENPRRPWLIFILVDFTQDASKQGFSALLSHVLNIVFTITVSKRLDDDPCVWYLINLMIESTLGLLLSYCLLMMVEFVSEEFNWEFLISGHYTRENTCEIDYSAWALQVMVWGSIVISVLSS